MTSVINTAEFYIQINIKRNKLLQEVIRLQNIILQKKILAYNEIYKCNTIKYDILQKANEIETVQLKEFNPEAHAAVTKMYKDYSKVMPDKCLAFTSDILKLEGECKKLMDEITKLNSNMPTTLNWANINYKRNDEPVIDQRFMGDIEH